MIKERGVMLTGLTLPWDRRKSGRMADGIDSGEMTRKTARFRRARIVSSFAARARGTTNSVASMTVDSKTQGSDGA